MKLLGKDLISLLCRLFSLSIKRQLKNLPSSIVNTDALPTNNGVATFATHVPKVTPSELVDEWLPWVHIAIANLKRFLLGTFHGISQNFVQEYLNEFCYRFNRRFWEEQIPSRLLKLCIAQNPIGGVKHEFSA